MFAGALFGSGAGQPRVLPQWSLVMAARSLALGQLSRPVIRLAAPLRALAVLVARRRALGQLESLDDRMLRDIGLSRGELTFAKAEPLYRDPTLRLVRGRGEPSPGVQTGGSSYFAGLRDANILSRV